jgi:hypothetical protein
MLNLYFYILYKSFINKQTKQNNKEDNIESKNLINYSKDKLKKT